MEKRDGGVGPQQQVGVRRFAQPPRQVTLQLSSSPGAALAGLAGQVDELQPVQPGQVLADGILPVAVLQSLDHKAQLLLGLLQDFSLLLGTELGSLLDLLLDVDDACANFGHGNLLGCYGPHGAGLCATQRRCRAARFADPNHARLKGKKRGLSTRRGRKIPRKFLATNHGGDACGRQAITVGRHAASTTPLAPRGASLEPITVSVSPICTLTS